MRVLHLLVSDSTSINTRAIMVGFSTKDEMANA